MKFYWGKNHQMWDYCIPLGPFVSENGRKYDLGIFDDSLFEDEDPDWEDF